MPLIKFPPSQPAIEKPQPEPELTAATMIREAVLSLPFWKEGSELKRIDACLEIEDALDGGSDGMTISTEARNLLKEAMALRMPSGTYGAVSNPRQNRFYMRVFRAVVVASDEK